MARGTEPGSLTKEVAERLRALLCAMQDAIASQVIAERAAARLEDLSAIVNVTESDTIYHIDSITEDAILAWFEANWPDDLPTEIVMEGISDQSRPVFPASAVGKDVRFVCIIDPIDGTRGLMYDKRSAWVLAGVALNHGRDTTLADIQVAVMTELPPIKQRMLDQLSAVRGAGRQGVRSERVSLDTGKRESLVMQPSRAADLHQGFVGVSRFLPAGKALLARFEEELYRSLYGDANVATLSIFEDQYICSGGQIAELCSGRDRMIIDIRPLAHGKLGLTGAMDCHPYDICTALILTELGGVVTGPIGRVLTAPLDTTTSVAWIGYANAELAAHVQPVLVDVLDELFSR